MIKLHYLENSRSQRILWFLEELNLDYEVIVYKRDPITLLAPAQLKEIHPLGKSPVIEDKSRVVAESGAIIEYLVNHYAAETNWRPKYLSEDLTNYNYWLHYAEASLMTPLVVKLITKKIKEARMPFFVKPIAKIIAASVDKEYCDPQISAHFRYMEHHLSTNSYFLGEEISAADIQMSFPIEAGLSRAVSKKDFPNIANYLKRLHDRPAYKRALEKGLDYSYA